MIYIIIFAIIFIFSLKKREQVDPEYAGKEKGLYLRGFSAMAIVLSHMVRNYDPYVSFSASYLIKLLVPSLVCLFFFYSGYGVMYSYKKKGQQYLRSFIPNFIIKLFVPSIIATLMAYIAFCITDGSLTATALKEQVLVTGGWYVWATVLMYLFFFVGALIFKDNLKGQLIAQCLLVGAYIVIGKMIFHISSTYYIDCPAFLLGSFVCVYKEKIDDLMKNKPAMLAVWGGTGSLVAGIVPVLISCEIIPSGAGIGTIAGLIGCISYPILMLTIVAWFDFRNDIFRKLGTISFEIYLVGRVSKYIGIAVSVNSYAYYTIYMAVSLLVGFVLMKLSAQLTKKILARIK